MLIDKASHRWCAVGWSCYVSQQLVLAALRESNANTRSTALAAVLALDRRQLELSGPLGMSRSMPRLLRREPLLQVCVFGH